MLEQLINNKCPNISHTHSKSIKYGQIDTDTCALCGDMEAQQKFRMVCPIPINCEVYLSDSELDAVVISLEKKLPIELIEIIIKYCVYTKQTFITYKLNPISIEHMVRCSECVVKFLTWINDNSCYKHILPRIT